MPKAKRRARVARDRYRDWLALQGSFVGRVASALEDASELVGAGSTEPRRWIEDYAKLWTGLIGDVGDWIKNESGEPLRPTEEWVSHCRLELPYAEKTASIRIAVPLDAFQRDAGKPAPQITVITGGLSRAGGVKGVLIEPGMHLRFKDPVVKKSDRYIELNLYDLPPLRQGDLYGGLVWARETKRLIAAVEVVIV